MCCKCGLLLLSSLVRCGSQGTQDGIRNLLALSEVGQEVTCPTKARVGIARWWHGVLESWCSRTVITVAGSVRRGCANRIERTVFGFSL